MASKEIELTVTVAGMSPTTDPEIRAMAAALILLDSLTHTGRARVLHYLADRFSARATEAGIPAAPTPHVECDAAVVVGALQQALDEARDGLRITIAEHRRITERARDLTAQAGAEA